MRVEKYFCDRCEKEVNSAKDLTEVYITVKSKETKECHPYPKKYIQLCDDCLDEIGFDRENNKISNPFNMLKNLFKKSLFLK